MGPRISPGSPIKKPDLSQIPDASVDFVYTMAVLQHLDRAVAAAFLAEFGRVLKPGGKAFCHFIADSEQRETSSWKLWFGLRITHYTTAEIEEMAKTAGFIHCSVVAVGKLAEIDDDIGKEEAALLVR